MNLSIDNAAYAYAAISGISFAEAVERVNAALRGVVSGIAAFDRLRPFGPIPTALVADVARGSRIRPPRRAARRAHARRLAKRR